MFRSNKSNYKIKDILLLCLIVILSAILGISLNSAGYQYQLAKKENVKVDPKDIKPDLPDTLIAFTDNVLIEVEPATPREKISSRAAVSRRDRGDVPNYIPIEEVAISVNMDLSVRTGLSKEDFISLISNCSADTTGFFEENAGLIYDLCEIYEINEIFFCGLISAESGWNIASNHRRTYNYISLMSSGGLIQFSSVEDGLESAARALHNNYLTPGGRFYRGSTLEGVRTIFCPVNPGWTSLVYGRMSQII